MKVASTDVDEAREIGGAIYHPHRVRHTTDDKSFSMAIEGRQVGPVLAGSLTYASPVELCTGGLGDAYQVNVALKGSFETTRGEQFARLTTSSGAIYGPGDTTSINGWGHGDRLLAVKLDRRSVEFAAGRVYRRPAVRRVDFGMEVDLSTPEARDWLILLEMAMRPHGLAQSPSAASSLGDAIANHPGLDDWMTATSSPRSLEHAVNFIDLNAHRQLTVAEVASEVGVCTRQLQQLFLDSVARPPSEVIREARLRHVRAALLSADPETTTVASVATAHDYNHLGRFAVLYKKHFGESPRQTLRD